MGSITVAFDVQKSATSETTEEPPLLSAQLVAVEEEESGTPLVEEESGTPLVKEESGTPLVEEGTVPRTPTDPSNEGEQYKSM